MMIRSIFLVGLLSVVQLAAFAQKQYFIYLQTDDKQQFTLKLNNKLHFSTASGYLILSKLKDSTYNFSIILPGDQTREQRYSIEVDGKDRGYLIKNFADKGWGLYDLQTSSVQYSKEDPSRAGIKIVPRKVSVFTQILALAARDPSLLETEILPQTAVLREEVKPETKKEEKPVTKTETETPKVLTESQPRTEIVKAPEQKTSIPEKKLEALDENEKKILEEATGKKTEPSASPAKPDVVKEEKKEEAKARPGEATINASEKEIAKVDPKTASSQEPVKEEETKPLATKTDPPVSEIKSDIPKQTAEKKDEPIAIKEERKETPVIVDPKKDEPVITKEEKKEAKALVKEEEKIVQQPNKTEEKPVTAYKRSVVTRRAESSTTEGFGLTFTDDQGGKIDTIKIVIPNPKYKLVSSTAPKEDRKFLDITSEQKVAEEKVVPKKATCKNTASENDFLKLRKKMAGENGDDAMIDEARKAFKQKCYSVSQIKNLSALFLDDGGKYKFFDESYTHVSDQENFSTLEKELRDTYYITRFKAMLR